MKATIAGQAMVGTRYELRKSEHGVTVWDCKANAPAVVQGKPQTDLGAEYADDLADAMNRLDTMFDAPSR